MSMEKRNVVEEGRTSDESTWDKEAAARFEKIVSDEPPKRPVEKICCGEGCGGCSKTNSANT